MALTAGLAIDAASGLVLIAFGALVALVKPRTRAKVAFAVFAVALGLREIVANLQLAQAVAIPHEPALVEAPLFLLVSIALAVFISTSVRPVASEWALGGLAFAIVLVPDVAIQFAFHVPLENAFGGVVSDVPDAVALAGAVWLAGTFQRARSGAERVASAATTAALMVWIAADLGVGVGQFATTWNATVVVVMQLLGSDAITAQAWIWLFTLHLVLPFFVVFVAWTMTALRVGSRTAWGIALGTLAILVLMMSIEPFLGDDPGNSGINGATRTTAVVILAFAFARGGLFEGKIAIRRGAIATSLVAVILIIAQVAQNFLAAQYGLIMGGVIAGALVFAASPIQRAAERMSAGAQRFERAGAADAAVSAPGAHRHARAYRLAVKAALADGTMTADEESHLADLAEELDIGAGEALRLRREVEGELAKR